MLISLYTILWFKGNAKIIYNLDLSPWQWWLATGLITNYLGLLSWWYLVQNYGVYNSIAITYVTHSAVELSLSAFFFKPPNDHQLLGLLFLIIGGLIIIKG